MKQILHWWTRAGSRGYRGPRHAALLRADGRIDRIDLVTTSRWGYDLSGVVAAALLVPASGRWSVGHRIEATTPERAFAVAARLERWLAWRERWLDQHPEVRLEEILRGRDWYSHMSDDFAVWASGERQDAALRDLCAQVPDEVVRALWSRYAPPECAVPGGAS